MKKISLKVWRRTNRKSQKGAIENRRARLRRQSRRFKKNPPKVVEATLHGVSHPIAVTGTPRRPPEHLCIDANRDEVLDFLTLIRRNLDWAIENRLKRIGRTTKRRQAVVNNYWDYTKIKFITPTVALMVAAEYDRASMLLNYRFPAINKANWRPVVAKVMEEVGFFDLLQIDQTPSPHRRDGLEASSLKVLKMRSHSLADSERAGEMINELEALTLDLEGESTVDFGRLYGALFEGITNTRHHAYPPEFAISHKGQWWATGAVDKSTRTISAVIYDQGVTIPANLVTSWMADRLKSLFGGTWAADGATLAAAMKVSRSSTGKPHRGLGLAEMEAFTEACESGRLRILSRFGEYVAEAGKAPQNFTHAKDVKGTLVQWDVKV